MLRLRSAQAWATPASCFEGPQYIAFGDADSDGLPDILQENHYYPFGMAMTMSSTLAAAPPNNYLYNGKELQDELDLGWYDYGARMYACPEPVEGMRVLEDGMG